MKNKILALLMFAYSYAGFAQTRNIWFSNSDTVNIGDSAWVEIKYSYSNSSDTCRIYISNSFGLWEVFKMTYAGVDTLKKYHTSSSVNPLDSVTRINFIIPQCYSGQSIYLATNQVPVYIRSTVGINELYRIDIEHGVKYYDMMGREVPFPFSTGQILIKITYINNTIKTQKIIYEKQ